jgi:hypothetical protein
MRPSKKTITILGIGLVILASLVYFYVLPIANEVYSGMKLYETHVAYRDDYKMHTTPLSQNVVDDLCLKLEVKATSENCESGVVVYAPELFDEIKTHFINLPDQDKTYNIVQNKLGSYLVECEQPDPDGDYRCRYDLQGDKIYPVFFYFDKDGFYWRIIANTGGS